jgi:hypothetical protein
VFGYRMLESKAHAAAAVAAHDADRREVVSSAGSPDQLAVILAGPVPETLMDAYQSRHALIAWIAAAYPQAGDAWERQLGYAIGHAPDVRTGRMSLERYCRVLTAIGRDPDGLRHGRRVTKTSATRPSDFERLPTVGGAAHRTESFGPALVAYVSTAVAWQLPPVITDVLVESTDLLVDLAAHVAEARSRPFDMRFLIDRTTWGRWRASSVLGHLPDRTRRSVEHLVCGHPSTPDTSALHLMHTVPAADVPLSVVAWWRGNLPGLHPQVQETYGRNEINRARLGIPPAAAQITRQRSSQVAI